MPDRDPLEIALSRARPEAKPDSERQSRIINAVHAAADTKQSSWVIPIYEHLHRYTPGLIGAAAAVVLGVWLFKSAPPEEPKVAFPFFNLALPGAIQEASEETYEDELKYLQRDLFRTALFVGDVVESSTSKLDGGGDEDDD